RPRLRCDDFVENSEVRFHQVKGDQVPYPLVEFGGSFEIGKQERQAGDLETLVDIDRVGAVDIAKDLVGQQALCGQERFASAKQLVQLAPRDPQSRQDPRVGTVLQRQAQRTGMQLQGSSRHDHSIENE